MEIPVTIFMICLIPGVLYVIFRLLLCPGTLEARPVQPRAGGPVRAGDQLDCLGTGSGHQGRPHHHTAKAGDGFSVVDRCEAGIPPPVPEGKRPASCPVCHHNHFGETCPPAGHRVVNARTGEVVGYWRGRG